MRMYIKDKKNNYYFVKECICHCHYIYKHCHCDCDERGLISKDDIKRDLIYKPKYLLTDNCFKKFDRLMRMVKDEHNNQVRKWGIQTHTPFEWLTYTTEELGSLAKAIGEYEYRDGTKNKIISEAIQVATLSLKIAEMYMG